MNRMLPPFLNLPVMRLAPHVILPGLLLVLSSCASSNDFNLCDSAEAVPLGSEVCLVVDDQGKLNTHREEIIQVMRQTVAAVNQVMPVDHVRIRLRVDPSQVIPEIGIGGFSPNDEEIWLWMDPDFSQLAQSIATHLGPTLAHEMHHTKRRRAIGYGTTLLQACISEGLADHFSVELYGIDPPLWSQALTGDSLKTWINTAMATWNQPAYDHATWFFGSHPDVPRWTGYAIGYELVKNYLIAHPNRKAADLYNEQATSFLP